MKRHLPAGCPNSPPCPHPAMVHESGYLDLMEVCVPGCPCRRGLEHTVRAAMAEARQLLEGAA